MTFSGVKALVVGQGSIGQRHARILREQAAVVATVSTSNANAFRSIDEAFSAGIYDYVIVANETSRHVDAIRSLVQHDFSGKLLVEKPLSIDPIDLSKSLPPFERLGVAYNLRFHPVVTALRAALEGSVPIDIRIHVGQYLPDWRPGSDYRERSSAKRAAGGGVLRDLSHEIDLVGHLFGPWKRLVSMGGNRGVLDIETDEAWAVLLELASGANVSLTLNYFDRKPERRIVVNTSDQTITADIVAGSLASNGSATAFQIERDQTYRMQHEAMLGQNGTIICTLEEAEAVMKTIAAIERSGVEERWVFL